MLSRPTAAIAVSMLALAISGFHSLVSYRLPMSTLPSSSSSAPLLEPAGVRVGERAVHHDDLAGRGLRAEGLDERAALHLADEFVVEGDVGVDRALGEAVVGDDRDARVLGLLRRRRDGLGVHRVHQDHVHLVVDHLLELLALLVRVASALA